MSNTTSTSIGSVATATCMNLTSNPFTNGAAKKRPHSDTHSHSHGGTHDYELANKPTRYQPSFRVWISFKKNPIVVYKKLLKQWEQDISNKNQSTHQNGNENENQNDSDDDQSVAEDEDMDHVSRSSSPLHTSNGNSSSDDTRVREMKDDGDDDGIDLVGESDSGSNSSDQNESDSDSDSDDTQSASPKRRRLRYVDDYDANDPFIDDEAIMDDDDEMEFLTDDASEVLSSFVATQGKVQHKKGVVNREQLQIERAEAKKRKQLAKQSKKYEFPETMKSLIDRLKKYADILRIKDESSKAASSSSNAESKKKKQIPEEFFAPLTELESIIQSSIPAKDHKLAYTRIHKYLPQWNEMTIKRKMKTLLASKDKQRVTEEKTEKLKTLKHELKLKIDDDVVKYNALVASKPKKTVGNVKVIKKDEVNGDAAMPLVEYKYSPQWHLFLPSIHMITQLEQDLHRMNELNRSPKPTDDELKKSTDKHGSVVLREIVSYWPNEFVTLRQAAGNYSSYCSKLAQNKDSNTNTNASNTSSSSPTSANKTADAQSSQKETQSTALVGNKGMMTDAAAATRQLAAVSNVLVDSALASVTEYTQPSLTSSAAPSKTSTNNTTKAVPSTSASTSSNTTAASLTTHSKPPTMRRDSTGDKAGKSTASSASASTKHSTPSSSSSAAPVAKSAASSGSPARVARQPSNTSTDSSCSSTSVTSKKQSSITSPALNSSTPSQCSNASASSTPSSSSPSSFPSAVTKAMNLPLLSGKFAALPPEQDRWGTMYFPIQQPPTHEMSLYNQTQSQEAMIID